jgi:6-pyruvoyltetrahydropterin/6-carboxytetrahydropterin synthase
MSHELTVWKRFRFEAAHWLPNVPDSHKCHHMHGHSYEVQLGVKGQNDPEMGWVIDYADIKEAFEEWLFILDHHCLNKITGLTNSTAENLAIWIAEKLKPKLPGLSCVRVFETPDAWVEYNVK